MRKLRIFHWNYDRNAPALCGRRARNKRTVPPPPALRDYNLAVAQGLCEDCAAADDLNHSMMMAERHDAGQARHARFWCLNLTQNAPAG